MKRVLVYTQSATKDIDKLDPHIKKRTGRTLLRYAEDPMKHASRSLDAKLGTYRFRIGDYRVIFDLEGLISWSYAWVTEVLSTEVESEFNNS